MRRLRQPDPARPAWSLRPIRRASPALLRELSGLLASVGMRRRREPEMARAIRFSDSAMGGFAGGRLVGFGRLVSDHMYYGTLWDIAVSPLHQSQGLGRAIVDRLLARAKQRRLVIIGLFTAEHNFAFYQHLGFRVLPELHPMTTSSTAFSEHPRR